MVMTVTWIKPWITVIRTDGALFSTSLIVVVNQGRIEATGTHEELLKKCPLYKEMWQAHIGSRDEGGATA